MEKTNKQQKLILFHLFSFIYENTDDKSHKKCHVQENMQWY